jgi:hypothetical protein
MITTITDNNSMLRCKTVKNKRLKLNIKLDQDNNTIINQAIKSISATLDKNMNTENIIKTLLSYRKIETFVDDEEFIPHTSFKDRILSNLVHVNTNNYHNLEYNIQKKNIEHSHSFLEQVINTTDDILIICDYNREYKYEQIMKYFSKIFHNIYILALDEKNIFLHNYGNKIKIIDRYHENDLIKYKKNLLNKIKRFDTVINITEINCTFINEITWPFRNRIYQTYNYIYNILSKKITIFINFKNTTESYGGGNQFVSSFIAYLKKFDNINIVFDLNEKIDIYLIIGIRKDNKFKRYSMDEIINNRKNNNHGKIICRINDCDFTRKIKNIEAGFVQYLKNIDLIIYNSYFIKRYYESKYDDFIDKKSKVIHNSSDGTIFYPKLNKLNSKMRIVTHHWSDNINKGYYYYKKLAEYLNNNENYEFVFIGRKFNDNYDITNVNFTHEMSGMNLSNELRKFDIYISASIYDACPMHVLEGLACGLPILYIDIEGGGRELCQLSTDKVGEKFSNFEELITQLENIKNNYNYYYQNIIKNIDLYNSDKCYSNYLKHCINLISK